MSEFNIPNKVPGAVLHVGASDQTHTGSMFPPGRVEDHGAGRGEPGGRPAPPPEPAPNRPAGGAGQRGAEHAVGARGHAETGQTQPLLT